MKKLLWGLLALGALGWATSNATPTTAPLTSPTATSIDPTVVPTGGEPMMPAGPPNPGFGRFCGFGHYDDNVKGVVRVESPTTRPPC